MAVLISACSSSSNPTGNNNTSQVYAWCFQTSAGGGTIVGIQGPFSNSGNSNFSFILPPAGATTYIVGGVFDVANQITIPSGPQSLTIPTGDYDQFALTGGACSSAGPTTVFFSSTSGINFTLSVANGACTLASGKTAYYSAASGTGVTLSGTIGQSGL